jgi:serine/threonine protein kinase
VASRKRTLLQLRREVKIYCKLLYGETGIPNVRWFGLVAERYVMVMDLLGKSLEDLFNYCNRRFTLKTVLVLAQEIITRIETIHNNGLLIHRDIKPENFLIGKGRERHTVYIIDFGLAKHFKNPRSGRHIGMHHGSDLTGTAR